MNSNRQCVLQGLTVVLFQNTMTDVGTKQHEYALLSCLWEYEGILDDYNIIYKYLSYVEICREQHLKLPE